MKRVFFNIGELATATGSAAVCGCAQSSVRKLHRAWLLEEDGTILAVGEGAAPDADEAIDCKNIFSRC